MGESFLISIQFYLHIYMLLFGLFIKKKQKNGKINASTHHLLQFLVAFPRRLVGTCNYKYRITS